MRGELKVWKSREKERQDGPSVRHRVFLLRHGSEDKEQADFPVIVV